MLRRVPIRRPATEVAGYNQQSPPARTRRQHVKIVGMDLAQRSVLPREQTKLLLWVRWALTFSPILVFSVAISPLLTASYVNGLVLLWLVLGSALACAFLIGLFQENLLHNYINVKGQWVLATVSGIVVLWPLSISVFFLGGSAPVPDWPADWETICFWGWAMAWITNGIAQEAILKRHKVTRTGWWVAACTFVGIAGPLLGIFVSSLLSPSRWWPELQATLYAPPVAWLAGIMVATATAGVCTASALVWLVRRSLTAG